MAGLIFAKRKDGLIVKLVSDNHIHRLADRNREKFEHIKAIAEVYTRIGLLEPDPLVRDRFMALYFVTREFVRNFVWLESISDELLAMVIKNLKDHIGYSLFPLAPEFDKYVEDVFGLGFGGALLRSLLHLPKDEFTYF